MKYIILIFCIFFVNISFSQNEIKYNYILNEHLSNLDSSFIIYGIENEFSTVRKYVSDSCFSETRIFTGDEIVSILFKIEKGVWYYKQKNNWKLFYDSKKKVGGKINFSGTSFNIKYIKSLYIRDEFLHKIILSPIGVVYSHSLEYYFNPIQGVIIIKSSNNNVLLRSDSFKFPLSIKEIEIL